MHVPKLFRGVSFSDRWQPPSGFWDRLLVYAQLGLALQTYLNSRTLLTEKYSLQPNYDDDLNITGFRKQTSLSYMVDFALDETRR